jgi:hypothetical protein
MRSERSRPTVTSGLSSMNRIIKRCHVTPAEAGRCRNLQVPAGPDAAKTDSALRIRQFAQDALAILEECRPSKVKRDPPRGAQ